MSSTPYNPLDKDSIGDNIVRELMARPCVLLPAAKSRRSSGRNDVIDGAGIYALYYLVEFPAYAYIASANIEGQYAAPIYIGKADPSGGRKGTLERDASAGRSLYNRPKDHATSIQEVDNLNVTDFRCRYLVVDDIWISLGERRAMRQYLPLWNTLVDGFGNHDPGVRRKDQYRSDWDVVHPGRKWAVKLGGNPKSSAQILTAVAAPPPKEQLEELAAGSLEDIDWTSTDPPGDVHD